MDLRDSGGAKSRNIRAGRVHSWTGATKTSAPSAAAGISGRITRGSSLTASGRVGGNPIGSPDDSLVWMARWSAHTAIAKVSRQTSTYQFADIRSESLKPPAIYGLSLAGPRGRGRRNGNGAHRRRNRVVHVDGRGNPRRLCFGTVRKVNPGGIILRMGHWPGSIAN
jgi:hypothetical protein